MQHKICVNQTCYVIIKASGQQEAINIKFCGNQKFYMDFWLHGGQHR